MKFGRAGALSFALLGPGCAGCLAPVPVILFFGLLGAMFYGVGSASEEQTFFEYVGGTVGASIAMVTRSVLGLLFLLGIVMLASGWCISVAALRRRGVERPGRFTFAGLLLGAAFLIPIEIGILLLAYALGPFDLLGSDGSSASRVLLAFALLIAASAPIGALTWRLVARISRAR
jgi:hypothetical protein